MSRNTGKILKIILFIGVYLFLSSEKMSSNVALDIWPKLFLSAVAYWIASLFGLVLSLTMNYILAIIITIALTLAACFKLDELVSAVSWLNDDRSAMIVTILAVLWMIKDIVRMVKPPRTKITLVSEDNGANTADM